MPRSLRIDLPGIAQHLIQRGNDRRPCFFVPIDYTRYLQDLREIARREGCAVHAYVLMTNHVHLLMTPGAAGRRLAIERQLGRKLGPKKIGRPRKTTVDTDDLLESRL